jgi:subtilisin family serine protease
VNAKNNGLIVLAGAGNNNCRNDFGPGFFCYNSPGMWADVIGVGAHDRFFYRSWWDPTNGSAYGALVDIWAPGGGGYARNYGDQRLFSTPTPQSSWCYASAQCWLIDNSNKTFQFGGTSASSPYAAGVAALMKQIRPWITQAEVISIMQSTGWVGPDPEVGKILDARAAIYALGVHP